jgi:hypothetical protein
VVTDGGVVGDFGISEKNQAVRLVDCLMSERIMFGFGLVRTGAQILDYNLVKRHQRFSLGAVVAHLNHKGERELRWPDPNDKFTTIASQLLK